MNNHVTRKECEAHKGSLKTMIEEAKNHFESSPETRRNLKIMNDIMEKLNKNVGDNSKHIAVMQNDIGFIKENIGDIKDFIKQSPQKFASKHVEKVVYAGIGIAMAFLLNELFNLI